MMPIKELKCIILTKNFINDLHRKQFPMYPATITYKAYFLLHKYFRKVAIQNLKANKNLVGAACLFLAAKIEDTPLKLDDLAQAFYTHNLISQSLPVKPLTEDVKHRTKNEIIKLESEILREIGFDLDIDLPLDYIKKYEEYKSPEIEKIVEAAIRLCNDSYMLPLCLYFHPLLIACACIHMSTMYWKVTILPGGDGKPWYKFLNSEIEPQHFLEVYDLLKDAYGMLEKDAKEMKEAKEAKMAHPSSKKPIPPQSSTAGGKSPLPVAAVKEVKKE